MIEATPKVTTIRKRLEKSQQEVDGFIQRAFEKERDYIVKLQTQEQLWEGLRADGQKIVPEYGPTTIRIKKSKGQPSDRVTLKDTGDFYKAMDVDFSEKDFQIINYDWKYKKLVKKYQPEIIGLNEESRELLKERIKLKLIKFLIQKLSV